MSNLLPVKSNITTVFPMQASTFNWMYLRCDWWYIDKMLRVIHHVCCQIQSTISGLRYVKSGPSQIQYNYNSSCAGINIQLNVSPLWLAVYRQIVACYTPHLLSNTEHNIKFPLCHIWSQSNPIQFQFFLSMLQHTIERISAAIAGLSTNQCALYSTFAVK
jgi:hypothetical protein